MTDDEEQVEGTTPTTKEKETKDWEKTGQFNLNGQVAPVAASILAIMAWAIFILLYALYWSTGFNLFQNIIVTVVSLFITALMVGLMWVLLGRRRAWSPT